MISKINYKGLEYTLAQANTGAVCLNVYDKSSREFIFASGICKNKEQLLALIKKTKTNYNDILNQCLTRVKNMTKELNFNKADIEAENMAFYDWQESLKTKDYRTWYAYLMKGGLNTYVGLRTGKVEYQFTFERMTIDEARRHLKFKHLRTNLDDGLTMFDRAMLKDCRRIAENAWKKDCGLGYQVKDQGR